jgi:nicotinate-nucleotide adenylyltransferase
LTAGPARHPHPSSHCPRAIALFGGSFDPIHTGHVAVAQAAARRFRLDAVHFIASGRPPHKTKAHLTPFIHRFTMVALACADHPEFLPSLAEAGLEGGSERLFYSIDTVRQFRRHASQPNEQLYFIVGADAFLEIPTWKSYEALLDSCDFIVAHRPGFRLDVLRLVIPPELLARRPSQQPQTIALRRTAVHLLPTVSSEVSSTEIRRRIRHGQSIHGLVPPRVEEYIVKQALYR